MKMITFAKNKHTMPEDFVKIKRQNTGAVLKEARELRGFSIEDVATGVGYAKSTISRIEEGRFSPNADQLFVICEFLNIPISINGTDI